MACCFHKGILGGSSTIHPFKAGNIARFLDSWERLTSDRTILSMVRGVQINFLDLPSQDRPPREYRFNRESAKI